MASSDEEMEDSLVESVTNYYFENGAREPVSFSGLPISWNTSGTIQSTDLEIYLRGNAGGGMIYKLVKAWKFDISGRRPEISVLSKDNNWIKLQKPRSSFEDQYIRTILVTVNFLHLVKRNPEQPVKRVWKKLSNIFSLHAVKPSPNDLLRHRALIEQAGEHDKSLKESNCFMAALERNPQMVAKADEDASSKGKSQFVVDDDVSSDDVEDDSGNEEDGSGGEQAGSADEEDDEDEPFDSVCSICDEGGPLLCCEGICMRSFHATLRAGKPSKCVSLGYTEKQVQDLSYFECQNCKYKLHQCFACGKLGSSDKQAGAEVFQCVNATCGYFYHPHCVAKLLRKEVDAAKGLEEKIRAGESFSCPLHICFVCELAGDKSNPELQMAVCRRCPKAYHKKCLPEKIAFDDEDEGIEQRAWEGLLVDRILLYCLKHKIIEKYGTPERNHIQFTLDDKKEKGTFGGASTEKKVLLKPKSPALRAPFQASSAGSKKKTLVDSHPDKMNDVRTPKVQRSNSSKSLPSEKKPSAAKLNGSAGIEERKCFQQKDVFKPKTEKLGELESTKSSKAAVKDFVLDSDSERRILDLMNEASSMVTLDDIIGKHKNLIPSRSYKQKMDPCKSITLGKVEGSCKAVREAAKKLDEGSSVKEAESICGPTVLNQMVKWKGKLRVYLAPFIHGMRYTSFGRHFTKIEKLKEIVDALHWYVNDDDMIVDFCCGANDFSVLMKEKLESRGKKCNYRNYDLFRPKNDFSFEKKDWMDVKPKDLPNGSKLIMGLNPPFGVKACKANQFINKALEFKPKLIILIVPLETERLDEKKDAYDLIWEHKDKLSGRSFYLPGSCDVFDKQMEDWNVEAPILSLWSRPDWTTKHLEIAKKYHHLPGEQTENTSPVIMDSALSVNKQGQGQGQGQGLKATEDDNALPYTCTPEGRKEVTKEVAAVAGNVDIKKQSTSKNHNVEKRGNANRGNKKTKKGFKQKRQREAICVGGRGAGTSQGHKRQRCSPDKPHREVRHHSPPNTREEMQVQDLRHQVSPIRFEHPTHHTSRYQEAHSCVEDSYLVHDYDRPTSIRSGNIDDPYHAEIRARYPEQGDNHLARRERWSDSDNFHPIYSSQNPVHPSFEYPRSSMNGYGSMNPPSGSVEQRYMAAPYIARDPDLHNNTSAINKYSFSLDDGRVGLGANNYGGFAAHGGLYHQHQGPAAQGYPGGPMGFAQRPPNNPYYSSSSGGWIN